MSIYLGADLGTSGLRVVALDEAGKIRALVRRPLKDATIGALPESRHEQRVESWREALRCALREVGQSVGPAGILAIACDGTSGTLVALDESGGPVRPAILYDDRRASQEALQLGLDSSYALPKALWLSNHEPETLSLTHRLATPADALNHYLLGELPASDTSSAMKLGASLDRLQWIPQAARFEELLGPLVAPGTVLGEIPPAIADDLNLPPGTQVVAGATDGTAGTLASGISRPGDWCATLGTTLVVRGLSEAAIEDPENRFYNHRHPDGFWMPGGSSYVGGGALEETFPQADIPQLVARCAPLSPTETLCYPLAGEGERFPFNAPSARGFCVPAPSSGDEHAAAILQGLAFAERLGLELAAALRAPTRGEYRLAGRTAGVPEWARLRADTLGRPVIPLPQAESSVGAAMLAAAGAEEMTVAESCRRLSPLSTIIEPDPQRSQRLAETYAAFVEECERRFS